MMSLKRMNRDVKIECERTEKLKLGRTIGCCVICTRSTGHKKKGHDLQQQHTRSRDMYKVAWARGTRS
jgi:hypothetical protein